MDIFKNWEMCKENNPKMKDVFETIEKQAVSELYAKKNSVRIDGQMLEALLVGEELDEFKQQAIVKIGAQSVYKAELDTVKSRSILNVNITNVNLFRAAILIYLVALVSDESYPPKMDLNIIFEQEIFIKVMKDLVKNTVPYMTANIDKIRMVSKES